MAFTSRNAEGERQTFETWDEAVAYGHPDYAINHPGGEHPSCKNALGTPNCERCKRDVFENDDVCPASKPEDRWDFHPGFAGCIVTERMMVKDALDITEEELQALEKKPEAEILTFVAERLGKES